MMRAVEHYKGEVETVPIEAAIPEVAEAMRRKEMGSLVVLDGRKPVGIVTDRDLVCRVIAVGRDSEETTAGDVMSSPLLTADPREPLEEVVQVMAENGVRRVPVVHGERLQGIVSLDDALAQLSDELADLAEGTRRELRAANGRRLFHELESLVGEVSEQIDRLGAETRRSIEQRIEALRGRIGLGRS